MTTDTVGGVWRFGLELTTGLLEAGDAVALVSFGDGVSTSQREECERLSCRWEGLFSYVDAKVSLEWMLQNEHCMNNGSAILNEVAQGFGSELLHSNQYCYGAMQLGVPKIVTAHSDVLSWAEACRGGVLNESDWLRRYRGLVQRGLSSVDALIAPTEWMLQKLGEYFELPKYRATISNGRTLSVRPAQHKVLRAVTAGRLWDEAKDVSLLNGVVSPIPLVIAGATTCNGSRADGVANAQYTGELSHEELLRLFAESAIYICTSKYEPFGLAPLESALCGCAVLARDINSLHEIWEDGALYFTDAEDLSNLLAALVAHPDVLHAQQQRSGMKAKQYTRARMTEAYRALYRTVMEQECSCVR